MLYLKSDNKALCLSLFQCNGSNSTAMTFINIKQSHMKVTENNSFVMESTIQNRNGT